MNCFYFQYIVCTVRVLFREVTELCTYVYYVREVITLVSISPTPVVLIVKKVIPIEEEYYFYINNTRCEKLPVTPIVEVIVKKLQKSNYYCGRRDSCILDKMPIVLSMKKSNFHIVEEGSPPMTLIIHCGTIDSHIPPWKQESHCGCVPHSGQLIHHDKS